jgi:tyrosinase
VAREKTANFALACWDWTAGGIPEIYSAAQTPDGRTNPLFASLMDLPQARPSVKRLTARHPGRPDQLPTSADVVELFKNESWPDFADALETNFSDLVHGWVGGDMGVVPLSSYDPLFYAHECMIDRMWAQWQDKHQPLDGPNAIDPALLDLDLAPFGRKVRDVLDIKALGYRYE